MVVVLHARTGLHFVSANNESFADLISRGLGALGVPLFLFISGFLSSTRPKNDSSLAAVLGIAKRAAELAGVYILWNVLVVIAVLLMIRFGLAPGDFLSSRLNDGLAGIFGLNSQFPIAYQFWFIRELILISLIIGCVGEFTKNQLSLVIIFCIITLLTSLLFDYRTSVSLVAYCLGYWSGRERVVSGWADYSPKLLRQAFTAGLFASALLLFQCVKSNNWTGLCITVFLATGAISVLSGALMLAPHVKSTAWSVSARASFFIFAAHEPLLTALKKVLGAKLSAGIIYVATPVAVVLILFAVYILTPARLKDMLWFIFRGSQPRNRIREHGLCKPSLR
jgi:fucose 4-O-acetylase-like acetyltransferase